MSSIKYIQITSLTMEDTNDLVNEIAKVQKVNVLDIKKLILEMKDTDAYLKNYKCNLMDLAKVIAFYDYPVKLRIEYLDESPNKTEDSKKKYTHPDETSEDIKFLQEQLTEIKDDELKPTNVVIAKTEARIQEEVKVDPTKIPDFL